MYKIATTSEEEIVMLLKHHPEILVQSQGVVIGIITKVDLIVH